MDPSVVHVADQEHVAKLAEALRRQGVVVVNRSANGASYSGLAIAAPALTPGGDLTQAPFLYATNSAPGGKIDVFDSRFNLVNSFDADPKRPVRYDCGRQCWLWHRVNRPQEDSAPTGVILG